MSSTDRTPRKFSEIDTDRDHYPDAKETIQKVVNHPNFPEGPAERIEVNMLANGEATYRVYIKGVEEPEGGAIPSAVL